MPVNESAHIYHTWASKLSEMFAAPPPAVDTWWESFIIFKSFKFREFYPRSWTTVEWLLLLLSLLLLLLLLLFLLCAFLVGCSGWFIVLGSGLQVTTGPTILDKNVKKNARCMCNLKILPSKARFTQDTPPSFPKKQCWSVARTFLLPTKQHWPGRGGGRGHHGAKFAG